MLPKKKTSKCRKRTRRSHHAKTPASYVDCPRCNTAKLPHAACDNCGYVREGLSLNVNSEE